MAHAVVTFSLGGEGGGFTCRHRPVLCGYSRLWKGGRTPLQLCEAEEKGRKRDSTERPETAMSPFHSALK